MQASHDVSTTCVNYHTVRVSLKCAVINITQLNEPCFKTVLVTDCHIFVMIGRLDLYNICHSEFMWKRFKKYLLW